MNPREQIDSAMGELSALPSFRIFTAWLDTFREDSISSISTPMCNAELAKWESGRISMIDDIMEKIIDNQPAFHNYEFTGRGVPARRQGKNEEGS